MTTPYGVNEGILRNGPWRQGQLPSGQTAKGPSGLPGAVTPQGTWPPCIPSNQILIIRALSTRVCAVVNSYPCSSPLRLVSREKQGDSSADELTTSAYRGRIQMGTLVVLVFRFNIPPQLIVASAISVTAYLALLGSLLTFRSIANGLYASAKRVRA